MESTKQRITDTLEKNYMPYAMSVIVSRAIPEIDGFKPSHRKLLYTMYKMRLLSGQKTKSANVVGQTMKLNPHGDQAIYATMVRLTRGYDALLHPYVDSKGNFGKATSRDMKYAAARYTEVKLDPICEELFRDIEKDMVDFVDSYDGRMKEPVLLPTTFPNILINANKGIAVGMASSICSFNLTEIIAATRAYLKNPEVDLFEHIKGPDFSTGGTLIYHEKEMREIYNTGLGSFKLRSKYRYDKVNQLIEIYEIPYTTTIEAIIEKVVDLIKNGRVKEISDIRDETDLSGLKITLDIKKGTDPDLLMTKLFKYTTLEDSFSCNFNLLVDGRPVVLGVKGILDAWIRFRVSGIRRKIQFELKAIEARLHLLQGLKKVLLDIDEAIRIIRDTPKDSEVVPNLMAAFDIDEGQADFIAEIKLRQINKEFILKRVAEVQNLEMERAKLYETLENDHQVKSIISGELKRIEKEFHQPRRTEIAYGDTIAVHKEEHDIEDFNLKVFRTAHGYVKKISLVSLRSGNQHKIKEDDSIVQELEGSNKDDLLVFTNLGNCYKQKLHEVEDHKASTLGTYLPNLLEFEPGEEAIYMAVTGDYAGWLLFVFENGKVAKVPLKSYETKTNRKKLVKAYSLESPLIGVHQMIEDKQLLCTRYAGGNDYTLLLVSTEAISEKVTKNTSGIQVLRLKRGSKLIRSEVVERFTEENEEQLGTLKSFFAEKIPASGEKPDPVEVMAGAWNERLGIK